VNNIAGYGHEVQVRFEYEPFTYRGSAFKAASPLCLAGAAVAAPVGGLALDREGSSRCARNTQLRYDESGRPRPHNRVVVSSAVAPLRGNARSITLTPAAQASGEWHGPPTFPAQFKALWG